MQLVIDCFPEFMPSNGLQADDRMGARMRCLNPDNRNAARPQQCHGNDRRNERNEDTEYVGEVYDGITNEIVELIRAPRR